jgi:hypothetical protein
MRWIAHFGIEDTEWQFRLVPNAMNRLLAIAKTPFRYGKNPVLIFASSEWSYAYLWILNEEITMPWVN